MFVTQGVLQNLNYQCSFDPMTSFLTGPQLFRNSVPLWCVGRKGLEQAPPFLCFPKVHEVSD